HSRFEPPEHPKPTVVAPLTILNLEGQWNPSVGGHREIKALAHDANNGEAPSVDLDVLADDAGIGGVALLPECVAQNNLLLFSWSFLFRHKSAAEQGTYSQQVEQVRGNAEGLHFLGSAVASKIHFIPGVSSHLIERMSLLAPIKIGGRSDSVHVYVLLRT